MDRWETFLPTVTQSLPSLPVLDARCRCSICKDYLQGPMMTLCGHTFCSLCIRRALNADGRCPVCRSLEEESKLRKNLMIEEILEAFLPFRDALMVFSESTSDRENHEILDLRHGKEIQDSELGTVQTEPPSSPTVRQSTRTTRAATNRAQTTAMRVNDTSPPPPPGHIQCPICQSTIHQDKADYHVNRCLEGKATPPSTAASPHAADLESRSRYFSEPHEAASRPASLPDRKSSPRMTEMKRLPKMSYAAMSDAKLRKAMVDMGINSTGSRAQLQRRCTEFIAMWNSNLDNKHPKSKKELLSDMKAWDRVQAKPVIRATKDEIDDANQSGRYDDQFSDLIAQARESLKKRKASEETAVPDKVEAHVEKRQHTNGV